MKLAEALIKSYQKWKKLKKRIYQNSQAQEGDEPSELSLVLIIE